MYLNVAVLTDMMVDTSPLICENVGCWICNLSVAIRLRAVLSSTTTQSADFVSLFKVSIEL